MYNDLRHTVKKLPDDKAGQLFKIILDYVNGENPIISDLLLDVVFEPVKLQIERDMKKWDSIMEERSSAGKSGGLKSGESRRSKKEANEAFASVASNNKANEPVTVNVNVTDNVKKEKASGQPLVLPFSSDQFLKTWETLKKEPKWKKKSSAALQASLQQLSVNNEADAIQMMLNSIAGNWQGIFPLDKKQSSNTNKTQQTIDVIRNLRQENGCPKT